MSAFSSLPVFLQTLIPLLLFVEAVLCLLYTSTAAWTFVCHVYIYIFACEIPALCNVEVTFLTDFSGSSVYNHSSYLHIAVYQRQAKSWAGAAIPPAMWSCTACRAALL